ncbi:cupin domain-containing protein [[Clostridium] symbiosum]
MEYEFLTPLPSPGFIPKTLMIKATLEPNSKDSELPVVHHSEETILILKGTLNVEIGDSVTVLHEGDTIIIEEDLPHTCMNQTDGYVEVISTITPPVWGTLHFPG